MCNSKTIHMCHFDKFIPPFIDFVHENIDRNCQRYYLFGDIMKHGISLSGNVIDAKPVSTKIKLIWDMNYSRKIIVHGLFDRIVIALLFFQPWLLKKCYWVVWGGDLYKYRQERTKWRQHIYELIRRFVIKNIGNIVTQVPGDYELAKSHYNCKGRYINSFVYPSNLSKAGPVIPKKSKNIRILLGNSASPSNDHDALFKVLIPYKHEDITIYCPLSYGGKGDVSSIIQKGKDLFGEKFIPLKSFMPFSAYIDFLADIDIAVFAHSRQQAFGNIITLLGQGKKVYLRKENTLWDLFDSKNIKIFDIEKFDLDLGCSLNERVQNSLFVKELFSVKKLCEELKIILM